MARIVEIQREFSGRLGVPVLTAEYEIVLTLLDRPDLTADELFESSSLSRAGFFNTLDRLRMWNVVVASPGDTDRRCRHYRLDGRIAELILSTFERYRERHEAAYNPSDYRLQLSERMNSQTPESRLDHISTEFQIIVFLTAMPGSTNTELKELIRSSGTTFNRILADICERGLVYFVRDEADKRRKRYYVSEQVARIMEDMHREVFAWFDTKRPD